MKVNTKQAYDNWSEQYDTNINKTRDMEALALQQTLAGIFKIAVKKDGTANAEIV